MTREVLEFYGDEETYVLVETQNTRVIGILEKEPGTKAREMLGKLKEIRK